MSGALLPYFPQDVRDLAQSLITRPTSESFWNDCVKLMELTDNPSLLGEAMRLCPKGKVDQSYHLVVDPYPAMYYAAFRWIAFCKTSGGTFVSSLEDLNIVARMAEAAKVESAIKLQTRGGTKKVDVPPTWKDHFKIGKGK